MRSVLDIASGVKRRLTGQPILLSGRVGWEHLNFEFCAEPFLFRRIQLRGYENGLCRLIMAHCGRGGIAVDAGMNYGFVTLIMAFTVGPEGHVHSFEPVPAFNDAVQRSLDANGITHVSLHRKAVGAELGTLDLRLRPSMPRFSVPMIPLDEALSGIRRLDFMKVDVDGPDLEALKGAADLITRFRPIIAVEVMERAAEFRSLLHEFGYRCFIDTENNPVEWNDRQVNVIASVDPIRVPLRGEVSKVLRSNGLSEGYRFEEG